HDSDRMPRVNDEQCSDLSGIEQFDCLTDKLVGPDGFRIAGHDVIDGGVEQIWAHVAAEIAVRDDADKISLAACDADAAEALGRHLQHGSRHFGAKRGPWNRLAA